MSDNKKAVVVISGGLDSVTLAHYVKQLGYDVYGISFNYGQRHKKELNYAKYQIDVLGGVHKIVDMTFMTDLLAESGSSLVTDTEVPEGHYGEESMKATVVPNRNMIMLSIASAYAISIGAENVWTGVHAGDHFIYPDCRPRFIMCTDAAVRIGNQGFGNLPEIPDNEGLKQGDLDKFIQTPFIEITKNAIAQSAFALDVDIAMTWSCYKGGDIHCGKCGTCVERLEAIASTGNEDPTLYEDTTFWLEALNRDTV